MENLPHSASPVPLKTSPGGYGVILYNGGVTKDTGQVVGMQMYIRFEYSYNGTVQASLLGGTALGGTNRSVSALQRARSITCSRAPCGILPRGGAALGSVAPVRSVDQQSIERTHCNCSTQDIVESDPPVRVCSNNVRIVLAS